MPPVKHRIAIRVQNVSNAHVEHSIAGVQLLNNAGILRNGKVDDELCITMEKKRCSFKATPDPKKLDPAPGTNSIGQKIQKKKT